MCRGSPSRMRKRPLRNAWLCGILTSLKTSRWSCQTKCKDISGSSSKSPRPHALQLWVITAIIILLLPRWHCKSLKNASMSTVRCTHFICTSRMAEVHTLRTGSKRMHMSANGYFLLRGSVRTSKMLLEARWGTWQLPLRSCVVLSVISSSRCRHSSSNFEQRDPVVSSCTSLMACCWNSGGRNKGSGCTCVFDMTQLDHHYHDYYSTCSHITSS